MDQEDNLTEGTMVTANEDLNEKSATVSYKVGNLYNVHPFLLNGNPDQPRKSFDPADMDALVASVGRYGVIQAILAEVKENQLVVVAGERRMRAAQTANLNTVPVLITDGDASETALVENLLRSDLTPMEEAEAVKRLQTGSGYKNKEIAVIIGKAESTVSEILALTRLPDVIKNKVRGSKVYTRAQLVGIAGKGKDEAIMIKQFEALETGKSTSAAKSSVLSEQLTNKINGLISTLNRLDLTKLEENVRTKLSDDLQTLTILICQKTAVEA